MKTMIAFTGAHGVGKTAMAKELYERLSREGFKCWIISEVARKCPFPIDGSRTKETQLWIMAAQLRVELGFHTEEYAEADYVIMDRCLLDVAAYSNFLKYDDEDDKNRFMIMINSLIGLRRKDYDENYIILHVLAEENAPIVDDGVRDTDKALQLSMNRWLDDGQLTTDTHTVSFGEIDKVYEIVKKVKGSKNERTVILR